MLQAAESYGLHPRARAAECATHASSTTAILPDDEGGPGRYRAFIRSCRSFRSIPRPGPGGDRIHRKARRAGCAGYQTLCEAHTLVLRRLGGNYARQWLAETLEGAVLLNPEPMDYTMAAAQLDRFPDKPITLVDAVTAVMAGRLGMPVWSFDRHFATMRVKLWR